MAHSPINGNQSEAAGKEGGGFGQAAQIKEHKTMSEEEWKKFSQQNSNFKFFLENNSKIIEKVLNEPIRLIEDEMMENELSKEE